MTKLYEFADCSACCDRSTCEEKPSIDDIPKEYHLSACCGCETDLVRETTPKCSDCGLFCQIDEGKTIAFYSERPDE